MHFVPACAALLTFSFLINYFSGEEIIINLNMQRLDLKMIQFVAFTSKISQNLYVVMNDSGYCNS